MNGLPNCYRCGQQPCECADGQTIYNDDCREVLPLLRSGSVDLVLTDPPYLTDNTQVPIRGKGVSERVQESVSVGMPWGYSLDWIQQTDAKQWVVFANYKMLGGVCSLLPPSAVFVWRKSNAPRMTRPVPRLDCEFIVWHRNGSGCEQMGEFKSLVIDVPMPQAGCMAKERLCHNGKALHPCQKPLEVMRPFIARLNANTVLDPFLGSGTTLRACKDLGRRGIGIEIEERYCEIAARRLEQGVLF